MSFLETRVFFVLMSCFALQSSATFMDPEKTVRLLNRYTFNATVQQEGVDNWIVLFCVDWWEPCMSIWDSYRSIGTQWENQLNASSFLNSGVRFARVDCATDKALCNEQNVQEYPSALHIHQGKPSSAWEIGASGGKTLGDDLNSWVSTCLMPSNFSDTASKAEEEVVISVSSKLNRWVTFGSCSVMTVFFVIIVWIIGSGLELWPDLNQMKNDELAMSRGQGASSSFKASPQSLFRPVVKHRIDL